MPPSRNKPHRVMREARPGAKRDCLSKFVARLKHDRTDDDAEECDCFFPQYIVSPGTSPTMRRTKCKVRRDSCDIVSFKTVRRRVVQTSSQVMCDSLQTSSVPQFGVVCLFSDSGQSHFKQEQFTRAGFGMMAGIERWESHECNKPGKLQTDYSMYQRHVADRIETTAVVQGVMVET